MSETQRFPFVLPKPGSPANKTLDYSIYLPISFSPGYDIHNRPPYAEHYNLSIQRELGKSTCHACSYAYVGAGPHANLHNTTPIPATVALVAAATCADMSPAKDQTYLIHAVAPACPDSKH